MKRNARRLVTRLAALSAAVGVLLGVFAAPASAAPNWQTYSMDTRYWVCLYRDDPTMPEEIEPSVFLRACVKWNNNIDAQPVAILSNYTGSARTITAPHVDLFVKRPNNTTGSWHNSCGSYSLSSGTARACYGTTITTFGCGDVLQATVNVTINGRGYVEVSYPMVFVCSSGRMTVERMSNS